MWYNRFWFFWVELHSSRVAMIVTSALCINIRPQIKKWLKPVKNNNLFLDAIKITSLTVKYSIKNTVPWDHLYNKCVNRAWAVTYGWWKPDSKLWFWYIYFSYYVWRMKLCKKHSLYNKINNNLKLFFI